MFLCYLIDPSDRLVRKVSDGFDRAAELTKSPEPELLSLWADLNDAESTVDIAYSSDADEQPSFRVRLSCRAGIIDRVVHGRAVLICCGAIPQELAQQIQTADVVARAVLFLTESPSSVHTWLKQGLPIARAPAKRSAAAARPPRRRDVVPQKR